jgi:hypothetical protein
MTLLFDEKENLNCLPLLKKENICGLPWMMKVIRWSYCCFVVSSTQDLEIYLKKVVNARCFSTYSETALLQYCFKFWNWNFFKHLCTFFFKYKLFNLQEHILLLQGLEDTMIWPEKNVILIACIVFKLVSHLTRIVQEHVHGPGADIYN